ncbi:hypothetical protein P7C71_g3723, partial [Lecanoromycetidae sp. Uapishka_2]
MPYNNATIPPPEDITGSATLPLARVKKILNVDEDTNTVSNQAAFAITIATEMFIRYLSDQAMNVVKSERKPRRNIQYKDIADAVARIDNLQFLEDVIPKTTTYKQYRINKAKKMTKAAQGAESLQNGQTTLDRSRSIPQRPARTAGAQGEDLDHGNISDGTIDEPSAVANRAGPSRSNGTGALVFEHYEPNGTSKRDESGDVEMS